MNKIYQIKWSKVRNCWCVLRAWKEEYEKKVQGVISWCRSVMLIDGPG
jgi:hypothetical protein